MSVPFTAVAQSTAGVFAGMLGDAHDVEIDSFLSEEASAEIAFGLMVKQGTGDKQALICTATTNKFVGIVVHSHGYAKDTELGSTGLKSKTTLKVLTNGRIWVAVEEDVTPSSAVRVRCAGTGTKGGFRTSADSTNCVDISKFARFLTTASASGFALLEIDMSGRANGVAD